VEARDEEGNTALMVGGGNMEMGNEIEAALVHKGARVNAVTQDGASALIYHAHYGQQRGLQLLLDHGADVNHIDKYGWTALMYAAQREGCERMVDALVKQGANVNACAGDGRTALMAAASAGRSATVRTLLQHGAIVDAQDQSGQTALTYTALIGNEACAQMLLEKGASVTRRNAKGTTLYQLLQERGDEIRGRNTDEIFISEKISPDDGPKNDAVIRLLKEHGMRE
jgi:ankyrin repeat protein